MTTSAASGVARGSALMLGGQAARVLIGLVATVSLARLLSPSDFGLIAMATSVVLLAEVLREFGLGNAALQAQDLTHQQHSNLFWFNSALGLIACVMVAASAPLLAVLYGQPELTPVVLGISPVFILTGMTAQLRVQLNRESRFLALALVEVLSQLAGLAVAITVASVYRSYWALVIQQLVALSCALVLTAFVARWIPSWPRRVSGMSKLLRFGANTVSIQCVAYAARNADSVGIGLFWGAAPLGFYDRANRLLAPILIQVQAALTRVALPAMSGMINDKLLLMRSVQRANIIYTYFIMGAFAILAGVSRPLVRLLFGEDWDTAGWILTLLALAGGFRALSDMGFWIFQSLDRTAQQLRFSLIAYPLSAVVTLSGLPWGPVGVACGALIAAIAYWLTCLTWAGRCAELPTGELIVDSSRVLIQFVIPSFVLGSLAADRISSAVTAIVVGLAGAWLVALVNFFFLPAGRRDRRIVLSFVQGVGRKRAVDPNDR